MSNREDRIRARAHALWESAGQPEGREAEHWAEAERLVDAEAREDERLKQRRGPGIDIAPSAEGNSLGDIRPAGPAGREF